MRNFEQPGKSMPVVAGGAIVSGTPYKVGDLIGIAAGDAASGEEYELVLDGVYRLSKAAATTFSQGAKVGWDATAGLVVASGSGDFDLGHAFKAGVNGETEAVVKLLGHVDIDT